MRRYASIVPSALLLAAFMWSCQGSQSASVNPVESDILAPAAKKPTKPGDGGTVEATFHLTAIGDLTGGGQTTESINEGSTTNIHFPGMLLTLSFFPDLLNGGACGSPTLPTLATIGSGNRKRNRDLMGMLYGFDALGKDGKRAAYNLQIWGTTTGTWLPAAGGSTTVNFTSWEISAGRKNKTACTGSGMFDATITIDRE